MRQESNGRPVPDERKVLSSASPTPRMPPACATFMVISGLTGAGSQPLTSRCAHDCVWTVLRGRTHVIALISLGSSTQTRSPAGVGNIFKRCLTLRKKEDMTYRTTPSRHFSLNHGWHPRDDECGLRVSYAAILYDDK